MLKNQARFIVTLALLLVCGFLVASVVHYATLRDTISTNITEQALPLTSDNIYSVIERDLLRSVLISSMMANNSFVQDWIHDGEKDAERMIQYLSQVKKEHQTITAFFVSERNHQYYHPDGILERVTLGDPVNAWYFRVREMTRPYEINIDTDTADRNRISIFINYRVEDETGKLLGAIGVGIAVNIVRHLIQSYQEQFDRQIYFVDKSGNVVLRGHRYNGKNNIYDDPRLSGFADKLLHQDHSSFSYQNEFDQRVFVNARYVPDFDWYLLVEGYDSAIRK